MCNVAVAGLAIAAIGAAVSAKSAYDTQKVNNAVAKNNEAMAEQRAQEIQAQGERDAQAANRQAREVMGAQRAAYAARGLDLNVGTPGDVIAQTDFFGQSDAAMARDNARKNAWATRAYGVNATAGNSSPWGAAGGSLLGNAGAVAKRWYEYQSPSQPNAGLSY